jgi:hypothetical protein
MRRTSRANIRRGISLAETGIVIVVFLFLILGMMDLGIGVFRHNTISQAARQGARQASVHGELALDGWNGGKWGPTTIDQPATATGIPVVETIRPSLVGCNLKETRILVEWPDGGNRLEQRVRVTITTTYRPFFTSLLGNSPITLRASSTMPIAH